MILQQGRKLVRLKGCAAVSITFCVHALKLQDAESALELGQSLTQKVHCRTQEACSLSMQLTTHIGRLHGDHWMPGQIQSHRPAHSKGPLRHKIQVSGAESRHSNSSSLN